MAMPREDNSLVNTRQKDLMAVLLEESSFSTEAMASRREVRTDLSCFGLLIADTIIASSASIVMMLWKFEVSVKFLFLRASFTATQSNIPGPA